MSLLAQTSTQQLVTSSITARTAQFQTLSTLTFSVSSINGIVPGGAFNGSTMGISSATVNTSSLQTLNLRSVQGYISSLVVDSLAIGSNNGFIDMGDVITTSLSSIQINTNFFSASGPVCTPQIIVSTINGQSFAQPFQSTFLGLGTAGYISSSQLFSTVAGIGSGFTGSTVGLSAATINVSSIRSISLSSVQGYVSSFRTDSLTVGGPSGYVNIQDLITQTTSTGQLVAGSGFISSLQINSLSFGPSGYVIVGDVIANSLSTQRLNTQALYTNNAYIGNVSSQSAILFPGIDGTFKGTAIAERTTGIGTQELLLYKASTTTDQIRLQTTGNIVFEVGAPSRSWNSTTQLATPSLYIAGSTSNIGIGTATPATTFDVVGTGRFQILSTLSLNVSSINGAAPGGTFNGSTLSLSTGNVFTGNLLTNNITVNSTITANIANFSPKSIHGLQMWMDAADATTFNYSSGSTIRYWLDKSGNGYDASNYTNAFTSTTSVVVSGSGFYTHLNASGMAGNVFKEYGFIVFTSADSNDINVLSGNYFQNRNINVQNGSYIRNLNSGGEVIANIASPRWQLHTPQLISWSSGGYIGFNASTIVNSGSNFSSYMGAWGQRNTQFGSFSGTLREIVIYQGVTLSSNDIYAVEGYLAWKWGITTNMISTHPYKNFNITTSTITTFDAFTTVTNNNNMRITTSKYLDRSSNIYPVTTPKFQILGHLDSRVSIQEMQSLNTGVVLTLTSGLFGTLFRLPSAPGGYYFSFPLVYLPDDIGGYWDLYNTTNGAITITVTNGRGLGNFVMNPFDMARITWSGTTHLVTYSSKWPSYLGQDVANSRLGINTAPSYTLDVAGNARFTSNVGIGTTPLSYTFDVAGNARFTSNVGIGTTPLSGTNYLDVIGTSRFQVISTVALNVSSINGAAPGGIPFTGSTTSLSAGTIFVSSLSMNTTLMSTMSMVDSALVSTTGNVTQQNLILYFNAMPFAGTQAWFGQMIVPPGPPLISIYPYTGSNQTFVVPIGVNSINAYMWAAGGGGVSTASGGAGAFIQAAVPVTPGETLTLIVGGGGGVASTIGSFGGGGAGGGGGFGTQGGGRTAIQRGSIGSNDYVVVGAGGGGTSYSSAGAGGAGGIAVGSPATGSTGLEGQGGTQAAGGAGSSGVISAGAAGSLRTGGAAGAYGGGGGAGYYGGGGSGATSGVGASGGGGSSLVNNVLPIALTAGSGATAPNTVSQFYVAPVAAGGTSISGTGGNGLIVVSYTAAPPVPPGNLMLTLNGTTATLSWSSAGATLYYWAFYGNSTSAYSGVYLMSGSTSGTSVSYSVSSTLFEYFRLVSLSPLGCISEIVSSPIVNVPEPSGLTLTANGDTVTMSWSAVSGATGYTYILYSNSIFAYSGSSAATASVSGVSATYSSGTVGTYYYFTVSATTAYGTSLLTTSGIVQNISIPITTGGNTVSVGTTRYHIFTMNGTFALSTPSSLPITSLIIAGGGGGGTNHGGGGGAGEVSFISTTISNTSYSIVVGTGGAATANGANSSAFSLTAAGGGSGGGATNGTASSGGSGGGGSGYSASTSPGSSTKTTGLGNAGGSGFIGEIAGGGGGGGGSGTVGSNAPSGGNPVPGGRGGNGTTTYSTLISAISSSMPSNWQTATSGGYIAAGGGGGNWSANPPTEGGLGGGGTGGTNNGNPIIAASNAINFTGSGGGGGGSGGQVGASGGTGLVVVMYEIVAQSSPTGLALTPADGNTATLSWTASPGATGYNWVLYRSPTNGYFGTSVLTGSTNSTTYTATATGLNFNFYYYFTVIATGTVNSAAAVSPIMYELPDAPSGLTITTSAATVNMSWSATAGALYYTYTVYQATAYAYTGIQVATAVNGTATSATYTGITTNYYYFTVSVTTNAGTSVVATSGITQIGTPVSITATGGELTTSTLYNTYRFTSTGTTSFTLTSPASVSAQVLIVAGGGGGGSVTGGGAGAGGVISSNVTFSAATYSVVVGTGGAGGANFSSGSIGSNSSFNSLIALGGGGGGGNEVSPLSGGSGGGGGWAASGAAGTSGQGFAGGNSATSPTNPASGGGGAGGVGGNAVNNTGAGGAGGIGQSYTVGGNVYTLGGGGGGGADTYRAESAPGGVAVNGGGNGGSGTVAPVVGTPNTGGGGGGGGNRGPISGANGGSGIIVIAVSKIVLSPTNPLLVSSGGSASMSWTAASGAQGYSWILYQSASNAYVGSSFATGTTTSLTTATASGLTLNSYYYFTVATTGASGSSPAVASAIVLQRITGPATATLTISGTTLSLSWDSVVGATSYTYTIYSGSAYSYNGMTLVTSVSTASTSATYAGTTGTYYYFGVTATTASGTSAPTSSGLAQALGPVSITATGGTATTSTGYNVFTFTTVGTTSFTLTSPASISAEVLIVGGGGGGGATTGGGGGAGGVITSNVTFSSATYSVLVGAGGPGGTAGNTGTVGSNSSFNSLIAVGGGGGGGNGSSSYPPTSGGSGGGGGWSTSGAAATSGQGFAGGNGASGPTYPAAGGGGAGGLGGNGIAASGVGGAGGIGQSYTVGGTVYTLAGGGGGGPDIFRSSDAVGGIGVNGGGRGSTTTYAADAGTPNTGGGGGGATSTGSYTSGANGGSGIIILALRTLQPSPTSPTFSITSGTASLGWTASSGATGYSWILYRSSTNSYNGTSSATGTTSSTSATSSGLSSGFFWYFTVAATSATLTSQVAASSIVAY